MSYLKLGKEEGAELLQWRQNMLEGDLSGGYYIQRYSKGITKCVFSRRNFDPF
jgi:hypothetical protein